MPKIKFNRSSIPKQQPLPQMVGKKHTTCAAIKSYTEQNELNKLKSRSLILKEKDNYIHSYPFPITPVLEELVLQHLSTFCLQSLDYHTRKKRS